MHGWIGRYFTTNGKYSMHIIFNNINKLLCINEWGMRQQGQATTSDIHWIAGYGQKFSHLQWFLCDNIQEESLSCRERGTCQTRYPLLFKVMFPYYRTPSIEMAPLATTWWRAWQLCQSSSENHYQYPALEIEALDIFYFFLNIQNIQ